VILECGKRRKGNADNAEKGFISGISVGHWGKFVKTGGVPKKEKKEKKKKKKKKREKKKRKGKGERDKKGRRGGLRPSRTIDNLT